MEHFTTTIALVGIVIVVAALLSGALERSGLPLVAVFLVLGVVLGPAGLGVADIGLRSPILQTLATLGLTLVLFSDAVTLQTAEIRAQKRLTWRMLGPGTLVPAVLIAVAGRLLLDLSVPAAVILGAALASTDPVLLRSVLRSPVLPARARVALRVESGMNDVVLLPLIVISMLALADGAAPTGVAVARSAVGLFFLGPALGALIGWVGIRVLATIRAKVGVRRDYESLYALGLAFTAFAGAEAVGGSGFLAAFAAGLLINTNDVELCDCFLEYGEATAEMLLLLTFVALGASLIWEGLTIMDGRTLLFAAIALVVRTVVLFPMLAGIELDGRERRLIALFGPRGLSSLLFALLPVFAGLPGAEHVFVITCLVVLLSVVLHGSGIALFLRATARPLAGTASKPAEESAASSSSSAPTTKSEFIEIAELRQLQARGEDVVVVDSRADRNYRVGDTRAAGSVRLPPEDAVRTATEIGLSHHATLVVYCA